MAEKLQISIKFQLKTKIIEKKFEIVNIPCSDRLTEKQSKKIEAA